MDKLSFSDGATIFAVSSVVSLLVSHSRYFSKQREIVPFVSNKKELRFEAPNGVYDAIIVGAGPAGATAAYFMGQKGLRVALIDKKEFPRHKPCGDAWCKPALDILQEMGVLSKMEADKIVGPVKRGGFISPFGYKCINTDGSTYGSVTGCKTYAIKRYIADEYLVKAASAMPGVDFYPLTEVTDLTFQDLATTHLASREAAGSPQGIWVAATKSNSVPLNLSGVMCLICDGSTSYLAQKVNFYLVSMHMHTVGHVCFYRVMQKVADILSTSILHTLFISWA